MKNIKKAQAGTPSGELMGLDKNKLKLASSKAYSENKKITSKLDSINKSDVDKFSDAFAKSKLRKAQDDILSKTTRGLKSGGKIKKGGMAAFEKSSFDKNADKPGGRHGAEGSAKDKKMDKVDAKKMGFIKKAQSGVSGVPRILTTPKIEKAKASDLKFPKKK